LSFRPRIGVRGKLQLEPVCDILFVIPAQAGIQGKIKMVNKQPAVYILASKRNGTLYIGVTSDLVKRIWEHKNNFVEGFTNRYDVHHLVWYELHEEMASAIERERNLKEWKRSWKLRLIESSNPDWQDLYDTIL
jgi:putative endonuclease